MKRLCSIVVLVVCLCPAAEADVWKWVDALGNTHFVDTIRPIYTWVDDDGKVHFADHPDDEGAVSVQLLWHSKGTLDDAEADAGKPADDESPIPGETDEQRAERQRAEAYYCTRATEVYESYLNAPQLYKTNASGEREYLSEAEAEKTIAETRARKDRLCK